MQRRTRAAFAAILSFLPLLLCEIRAAADDRIRLEAVPFWRAEKSLGPERWKAFLRRAASLGFAAPALLNETSLSARKGKRAFVYFPNSVWAPGCSRDFLIQRIHIHKEERHAKRDHAADLYLVEAFKLDKNRRLKRPDWHSKEYKIVRSLYRSADAEFEIGCGEIPRVAVGSRWPFHRRHLYAPIAKYSPSRGVFDAVTFDFSARYSLSLKLANDGSFSVRLPDFIQAGEQ